MDTDDLTPMAYSIISKADEILDVLRSEIGASCEKYETEEEFLRGTLQFVNRKIKNPDTYLDFWNFLDEIDIDEFKANLKALRKTIIQILDTPILHRGEPPFK
jgi:hypothetical protein